MEDRRAVRTKNAIRKVFLELLEKKSVNKITVSEISKRADIGRGTFYLHYNDPYDLLAQIEDELIKELDKQIADAFLENKDENEHIRLLFCLERTAEYAYAHKSLFKLMMGGGESVQFVEKFKKTFGQRGYNFFKTDKTNDKDEDENRRYYVSFLLSGAMGLFQQWVKDDVNFTPKRFAEIVKYSIYRGVEDKFIT